MRTLAVVAVVALVGVALWPRRADAAAPGEVRMTGQGPRGIRNHNPFNLRPLARQQWQGQAGVDAGNYVIFDAPASGLRAGFINLRNQQLLHKLASVRAIITKYAPSFENDTAAYIAAVARSLKVGPDDTLNLSDADTLIAFARAVIRHENGMQPYSDDELHAAAIKAIRK